MNFVRPLYERYFQVRDFSFRITEGIGLTGVSLNFWPQKQIPRGICHRNFWLLFHFHVKYLPIFMFLGLIWCKILWWAQKSILYGVWNATGTHESPKTEFVSHEIFISRVTYPSIRNFMLSSKKYTLRGLKCNHKSWEPKNLNKFKFLKLIKTTDMFSKIKALFSIIWVYLCS
jgi:hypothetical protein